MRERKKKTREPYNLSIVTYDIGSMRGRFCYTHPASQLVFLHRGRQCIHARADHRQCNYVPPPNLCQMRRSRHPRALEKILSLSRVGRKTCFCPKERSHSIIGRVGLTTVLRFRHGPFRRRRIAAGVVDHALIRLLRSRECWSDMHAT